MACRLARMSLFKGRVNNCRQEAAENSRLKRRGGQSRLHLKGGLPRGAHGPEIAVIIPNIP